MEKKQREMVRFCDEIGKKHEWGLQERDVKWKGKVLEMKDILRRRIEEYDANVEFIIIIICVSILLFDGQTEKRDETVRKMNEQMPELINAVDIMGNKVRNKDTLIGNKNTEITRLLNENKDWMDNSKNVLGEKEEI